MKNETVNNFNFQNDNMTLNQNVKNSKETNSINVVDPNNIVQTTFDELKKIPEDVQKQLGKIEMKIEYQMVPVVNLTFNK